jgi:glutamate:GABA antiporter
LAFADSSNGSSKRVISVSVLVLLNISIMASLRNLPLVAEFGYSGIIYFIIVGLVFLVPSALVSAELATGWPKSGGIYIWVREAFGDRWGFFAIWMQWVHNVTWYPAILAFVASTFSFVFFPHLADNPTFTLVVVLVLFWAFTIFNFFGIKTSTLASSIGVVAGTLVPGVFLILLGVVWFFGPSPNAIHFTAKEVIPDLSSIGNIVFLGGLFLSFAGLEVSAGYASEVKNPQKNYPKAIIISAIVVFFLFMIGSLAIAIVIPKENINLVTGLMESLKTFLDAYSLTPLLGVMAILLILGSLAELNSWIIGPVKALYETAHNGDLPPIFQKLNKNNMPQNLLIFQAIIVTVVTLVFLFMPSVSSSYWILSAISSQIYLVMYLFMFAAAIRLRYSKPHVPRAYQIPHPHKGIWIVASVGFLASLFALILLFFPPSQLKIGSLLFYESFLIIGLLVMIAIPLCIHATKKDSWRPKHLIDDIT